MRKIHKIMIAVFLSGVFLTGLGTGLALSEFSSFAYTGEVTVGNIEMKTDSYDYTFSPDKDSRVRIHTFIEDWPSKPDLITSTSVPENTIRFNITYNANAVVPHLVYSEEERYVGPSYYYIGNDFETFMVCKDQILKELKEKKISSYITITVEDIEIMVNPASADYVAID